MSKMGGGDVAFRMTTVWCGVGSGGVLGGGNTEIDLGPPGCPRTMRVRIHTLLLYYCGYYFYYYHYHD